MDNDNPIITCTVLQLAFVAWQKRLGSDDLTPSGDSYTRFVQWWDSAHENPGFASIRDACWKAWHAAVPRHGEHVEFEAWWSTILASQPTDGFH